MYFNHFKINKLLIDHIYLIKINFKDHLVELIKYKEDLVVNNNNHNIIIN